MGNPGWRGVVLTAPRRKMLKAMAAEPRREWTVKELELAAGTAEATTYQSLNAFEEVHWVRKRLESRAEHQARQKKPGDLNKGPRLNRWSLTETGQMEVNQL
jgi:Fe2+/Zn2+ uptake regulation proteins